MKRRHTHSLFHQSDASRRYTPKHLYTRLYRMRKVRSIFYAAVQDKGTMKYEDLNHVFGEKLPFHRKVASYAGSSLPAIFRKVRYRASEKSRGPRPSALPLV